MASWQRTQTCGELREEQVGQIVVLNGWVNTYRAYNDQIFVDLRDRYGITQVVFEADEKLFAEAQDLRNEFVLSKWRRGAGRTSAGASTIPNCPPGTWR